jgi:hypothetical protein
MCALVSGWRSLMLTSSKGMPVCRMASHGRKLQLEVVLSPITSL